MMNGYDREEAISYILPRIRKQDHLEMEDRIEN